MATMAKLLSLDEAGSRVLERVHLLDAEDVAIEHATGRYLWDDAIAAVDLPPFASSAMDGYAVRAADVPGRLAVIGRIAAGAPLDAPVGPGEAMGIATGGVVPDGADSVVPIELVVESDNGSVIEVPRPVVSMANVRPRGGDIRAGDVVVPAGTRLGPSQVGALGAAGVASAWCVRRPHATVLATGTELRRPGEALGPGQVYEANGAMLAAALAAAGAEVSRLASVVDDEEELRATLTSALDADVVVTSGGVSVGPHDLVRRVWGELGVEEVFWRVATKPGKPVWFGVRGKTLVFGLPGNPVSALVDCELFVLPALRALQGASEPGPVYELGRLTAAVRRNDARDELVRARRTVSDGVVELEPLSGQESHMIARAARADALVFSPRGDGELGAGEEVRYLRIG